MEKQSPIHMANGWGAHAPTIYILIFLSSKLSHNQDPSGHGCSSEWSKKKRNPLRNKDYVVLTKWGSEFKEMIFPSI